MAKFKSLHRMRDDNRLRAIARMHMVELSAEQSWAIYRGGREKHILVTELTKWLKSQDLLGEYLYKETGVRTDRNIPLIGFYFTNPKTAMYFKLYWG